MDCAAIVVGDEILSGHVQDDHTRFIALRLALHGHRLYRATVVADDPDAIAEEVRRDLDGRANMVFVCGGIGPTHDDRTMEGVAAALGRPMAVCPGLASWIEEIVGHVERSGLSPASFGLEGLRKMALAPEGADLLPCRVAPAVTIEDPRARVFVLPGPPREMQAVFSEAIEPRFLEGTGAPLWREEITHPFPESALAGDLADLQARYPATAIGSYPQRGNVLVRIAGPADEAQAVAAELRARVEAFAGSDDGKRVLAYIEERRRRRDA